MDTKGIDQMLGLLRATATQAGGRTSEVQASEAGTTDFAKVLQNTIEQVNQTQQQAEDMAAKFAAGDGNANLHDVMISLQKASLAMNMTSTVRNKILEAYKELMRMPF